MPRSKFFEMSSLHEPPAVLWARAKNAVMSDFGKESLV